MSNLLDLSEKIDPDSVALFEILAQGAEALSIAFLVIGASARDMIFELGHGLPSRRATNDVDFAVRVVSWDAYHQLRNWLVTTGDFKETRQAQRLLYRGALLVDFVPFGPIADKQGEIRWPPDNTLTMSTVGFQDAYDSALTVRVRTKPPLEIRVASVAGLAVMKIIAWADRPEERMRDAQDLVFILEHYLDAEDPEYLFEEHPDLVSVEDFDYVRAGARALGRDMARVCAPETVAGLKDVLSAEIAEGSQYRMVQAMFTRRELSENESEERFGRLLALLGDVVEGLSETTAMPPDLSRP